MGISPHDRSPLEPCNLPVTEAGAGTTTVKAARTPFQASRSDRKETEGHMTYIQLSMGCWTSPIRASLRGDYAEAEGPMVRGSKKIMVPKRDGE